METAKTDLTTIFSGSEYHTPQDHEISVWDKVFFRSRWPMFYRVIQIIFNSRKLALDGHYDRSNWIKTSLDVMKACELSGARFHIEGLDHLRSDHPAVVIVANHVSTLETFVLPALIASIRPATFVVKKKLVEGPVFGPVISHRAPIVVGRLNPREDLEVVLKEGTEKLKAGISVILFPESTRQRSFNPKKFNSLGVKLAKRAGVPVVPLALKTDFWGSGLLLRSFGPVKRHIPINFQFGSPLTIRGNGQGEHQQCIEFILDRLQAWKHPVETE
jgi:1-acyl-sn-glycerol-3-phosphate acyltransferase